MLHATLCCNATGACNMKRTVYFSVTPYDSRNYEVCLILKQRTLETFSIEMSTKLLDLLAHMSSQED